MDLPTCPACGQSVLDDDATDCPFCGAAMDGSSGPKTKSPEKASTPKEKKTDKQKKADKQRPDSDDPFAIKKAPTTGKVVRCARKPMKGRLHRVVCPMCDTQGFIPKKAIGMQVKCANPECLVPVFTATDGDDDGKPKVPTRVSDEELARPTKDASIGGGTSPLLLYGVVGGILLAATLGLLFFLDQEGDNFLPPPDLGPIVEDGTDEPDTVPVDPPKQDEPDVPDYRKMAVDIADSMTKTALVTHANRDKAFCRRMTGDAFLRLGVPTKADAEFRQMKVVASQDGRNTDYYEIAPRIQQYWRDIAAGDQAAATKSLNIAVALKDEIPTSGGIAIESAIFLAAGMIHTGDTDAATQVLNRQRGDISVSSQQDSVRYAAWLSVADTLRDHSLPAWPPEAVFFWHDPMSTATALQLAAHGHSDEAINWATSQPDPVTISDTLAVIAEFAATTTKDHQDAVASAAEGVSPETALRIYSVLAVQQPAWFTKATEAVARLQPAEPKSLGTFADVIGVDSPELETSLVAGSAYADFVIAAASEKNDLAVKDGLDRLYRAMASAVPPTASLRKASHDIKNNDRRLQAKIGEELKLRSERTIKNRFMDYRRGSDRLARVAEERRLRLIQRLALIAQRGGANVVEAALTEKDSDLRKEVMIDDLCGMIFTAAAAKDYDLATLRKADPKLAISVERVDAVPEAAVIGGLVDAWERYLQGGSQAGVARLDDMRTLTGLRAATANYMIEQDTTLDTSLSTQLAAVRTLRNVRWQERAMRVIAQEAAERGQLDEAQMALDEASAAPAGRIMYLHGLLTGLLRFEETETARLAAEAEAKENAAK